MKILITESQLKLLIESSDSLYEKFADMLRSHGWTDLVISDSVKNTKKDISDKLGDKKSKYESWVVKHLIDYVDERGDGEIIFDLLDLVKEFDQKQERLTLDNITKSLAGEEGIKGPPKDWFKYVDKIVSAPKDINSYSPSLLSDILENLPESKRQGIKIKNQKISKEVEKIYEDENILVVRPLSKEASCKYGANTKWCTAGRLDNRFQQYFDDGLLIYYIVKPNVKLPNERFKKMASSQSIDHQYNYTWYDSKDEEMPSPLTMNNMPEELKNSLKKGIESFEKVFNSNFTDYEGWGEYEWVPGTGWVDSGDF